MVQIDNLDQCSAPFSVQQQQQQQSPSIDCYHGSTPNHQVHDNSATKRRQAMFQGFKYIFTQYIKRISNKILLFHTLQKSKKPK